MRSGRTFLIGLALGVMAAAVVGRDELAGRLKVRTLRDSY
jgi:hypothetical protein